MALSYGNQDFRTLIEKLGNMERKVSKDISSRVLKEGGEEILKDMKGNVPVDTGHLKSSLEVYGMSGTGGRSSKQLWIWRGCNLHHSSRQRRIVNPPSKGRDRTHNLTRLGSQVAVAVA